MIEAGFPAGSGFEQRQVQRLAVLAESNLLARGIHNLFDPQIAVQFKSERGEIRVGDNVHARFGAQQVLGRKQFGIDDVIFDFEAWNDALRPAPRRSHSQNQAQKPCLNHPPATPAAARENAARFTDPN